jgi:hypothetical protein
MRRSDSPSPLSPHFVSFAWRYHRCVLGSSPTVPDAGPWIILELVSRDSGRHCDGDGGVSQVPGEPLWSFALFFDPGVTERILWVQL